MYKLRYEKLKNLVLYDFYVTNEELEKIPGVILFGFVSFVIALAGILAFGFVVLS